MSPNGLGSAAAGPASETALVGFAVAEKRLPAVLAPLKPNTVELPTASTGSGLGTSTGSATGCGSTATTADFSDVSVTVSGGDFESSAVDVASGDAVSFCVVACLSASDDFESGTSVP